ncbi:hypothetical protein JR316_0007840 [Psilocybe cubensis]|uniref:Myosin-binding domain-containing protein n=2 Tax=Psilocybe cubensis TaxID=181762 RepID=A0A8H8CIR9_PSICU|nr:hypothetical protein JR316_0007840 [Psilocybe cubensis]KAH9479252.1 hypothetical protein JR316_0007840 [Psilocybe cubensis]
MAQALFDEDAGESPFTIPGSSSELERELDPNYSDFDDDTSDDTSSDTIPDWLPQYITEFLELLQATLNSAQLPKSSNSFVEKFKYNVISSTLLAPSLPASHGRRSSRNFSIPGKLHHSATPSEDFDRPISPSLSPPPINSQDLSYGPITVAVGLFSIAMSIGYSFLALIFAMVALFLLYHLTHTAETPKHDMTLSFNSLDELVAANDVWESVVQDAVAFLEKEERTYIQGISGPSSPSPLRVALHSCLQTTHSQCDNIRQLFSALTSPTNLSQISEMYAPPSPTKSAFNLDNARSFVFPSPNRQSISSREPTTPYNKRSTWNGSYASLGYTASPTSLVTRRRDRHKLNLSDVFQAGSSSAPSTPLPPTPPNNLTQVPEHSPLEGLPSSSTSYFSPSPSSNFGSAALDLQRRRRSGGIEAFGEPPAAYFLPDVKSPRSTRSNMFPSTISSSSKFTNPQSARHPLSYSALTYTLQGALSAKRYTCSHLLALRFEDDEDEGYWEDVRSVIGLLTSSLTDGYSRLSAALEEVEQRNLAEQNPTPDTSTTTFNLSEPSDIKFSQAVDLNGEIKRRKHQSRISFAPMPSHISRFATHVAAISAALDDARENLEQCVDALKAGPVPGPSKSPRHSRSPSAMASLPTDEDQDAESKDPPALQAYERLRRELGMALRECERGRERLLELVNPVTQSDDEDEEEFDDLPGLGHDGSDDSDKPDANSPSSGDEDDLQTNAARFQHPTVVAAGEDPTEADDATSHLLLATSTKHLPMPGIEEVFEADTGGKVGFTRERTKMSREERIKLAKARRESGMGLAIGGGQHINGEEGGEKMTKELCGHGSEVVQELKDVIWKVGERKRKLAANPEATLSPPAATPMEILESL